MNRFTVGDKVRLVRKDWFWANKASSIKIGDIFIVQRYGHYINIDNIENLYTSIVIGDDGYVWPEIFFEKVSETTRWNELIFDVTTGEIVAEMTTNGNVIIYNEGYVNVEI